MGMFSSDRKNTNKIKIRRNKCINEKLKKNKKSNIKRVERRRSRINKENGKLHKIFGFGCTITWMCFVSVLCTMYIRLCLFKKPAKLILFYFLLRFLFLFKQ